MGLSVNDIESRARHVKIVTGDDVTLVEDGEITSGYITVALGRNRSKGSWLKINVTSNTLGGSASVLIKTELDSVFELLSPTRLESFDKGNSYHWGRRDKPAFKAV